MEWHAVKKEELFRNLKTSEKGLSEVEAAKRLEKYGENELKEIYKINPFKIFVSQFKSFLIYVLIIAALISLFIGHYLDAGVIFAITLINSTVGFIQQYKAETSIAKLRQLFIPQAKVFREGKLKIISSKKLVPGDIILFEQGDKITADCRILESENLELNEAILTGESNSVEKYETLVTPDTLLAERINMLYTGTTVSNGKVTALVVSTAMDSEFGKIALTLQEIVSPETPMQKKLDKFAKQIGLVIIALAALTFIIGILTGIDKIEMFLTSISIIVAAIPEGLPAVITISLAFATKRMLKHNVLIRRLPAAETLGSVTMICSDKTGTITEEKMIVKEIYCDSKEYKNAEKGIMQNKNLVSFEKEKLLQQLISTSVLSSNARFEKTGDTYTIIGDTTEAAFVSFALDYGINRKILTEKEPRIKEISFSSERKMMSILRKSERKNVLYCKGAPSVIIERSSFELTNKGIEKLDEKRKKELTKIYQDIEKKGLRVLGFAFKTVTHDKDLESSLIFQGFMGILDPPRKEVWQAIKDCQSAGIKVKMITGDSPLTAKTVANEVGIYGDVIDGRQLEEMTDEDLLSEIENIAVFARTDPKQKLRIVEILKLKGEQVAITGDGVNDILALKKGDIGIAMGKRGSDIARDVSDMVLLDDNFFSIVRGIEEGRVVYDNSKKSIKFLLSANLGEILLIAFAVILRLPLPILPLQILWVNLVTDSFPALALTKEKSEDVMKTPPRKESSLLQGIFISMSLTAIVFLVCCFSIFYYGLNNFALDITRTMVLMTIIGFEMFFVVSCRSEKPIYKIGFLSNPMILYAIISVIVLQLALIYTPLSTVFGVVTLSRFQWLLVLLASLPGLLIFEIIKFFRKK